MTFAPRTHLITSPRHDSISSGHIHLYCSIPAVSGYSLKRFTPTTTLKQVLERLNKQLPPHLRSDRYHLYLRNLQLLDTDRTLSEARIPDKSNLQLKRSEEYDLKIREGKANPDGELFAHVGDADTVKDATKKICSHAFGERIYRSQLKNYDFSITNEGLALESLFISYKFRLGDIIEVKAVPKAGGNIIYKTLEVVYSPISAREQLQKSFVKSGFLKKQGLKTKNWKKRYFHLDTEKLQYWEDQKQKKLLGTLYLDELESVDVNPNMSQQGNYYFSMSVPGRVLLMHTKDESEMNSWVTAIRGMAEVLRQNIKIITLTELEQSRDNRFKTNRNSVQITPSSGISGPYNPQHHTHITHDFKWAGDENILDFEELLGKGASGTVYRAKVKDVAFDVAVKKVTSKNPRIQAELEKEIDVLKKCKHPNIVAYYGTKIVGNEVWIIMDYCGVGAVKDVMKTAQETLSELQIAYVLQCTLKGLTHLHMRNILHLDLKSANILLNDAGDVKLADFGVSKTLASEFVNATNYIGSPLFMAPEVIRKDKYNDKADIWSLGITTIEMAEGTPPNTDIDSIEKLPSLAEREPPMLVDYDMWSPTFHDFIATMLVKDQEYRPSAPDCLVHPFVGPQNVPPKDCLAKLIKTAHDINESKRKK